MRVGCCAECGETFDHYPVTGVVPSTCSDECGAIRRRRLAQTPERRAYVNEWHQRNKDKVRDNQRRWVERHPDRRRVASSEYTKRNRVAASEQARRYRAKIKELTTAPFTTEQLEARLGMFVGCWLCGATDKPLEVDHVKPVRAGGAHILANLRPACRSCNASKGAKWPLVA